MADKQVAAQPAAPAGTEAFVTNRELALAALAGQPTPRVPVAVLTWGFDYMWKLAGLEPWQLACGSSQSWHRAHLALLDRHQSDVIWYQQHGKGPREPILISQDQQKWVIRDGNTHQEFEMLKDSYTLYNRRTGAKSADFVGDIRSRQDADALIRPFKGWNPLCLEGLHRLIDEVGDRALVLPHSSPAYICACYAVGFERAMEMMLLEEDLFRYICDRLAAGDELRTQQLAQAGAQACYISDSWASCDIISPKLFEKFALPYQRSIVEAAQRAGLRVILWNAGDVRPILDLEASLPLDAFGCEQSRKSFELRIDQVREVFGPHRCLLGNLDSEQLLLRNDPVQIRQAVAEQLRQSGPGNPFILTTGSPLPSNVDPSAVDTMVAAARECQMAGRTAVQLSVTVLTCCAGAWLAAPAAMGQLSDADAQAQVTAVFEGLDANPPAMSEPPLRRQYLRMLDSVCLYEAAPDSPPIRAAFGARMARALAQVQAAKVDSGAAVWMVYNMGVMVRTPTVTMGFDLVRGRMGISDDAMRQFVSQCDVLFVSHAHGDHADEWVRDQFLAQGKPVVAPVSVWPEDARLTRLVRRPQLRQELAVQGGRRTLEVVVYPGHQGDIENNVYCVYTPEGLGIVQTGDQANDPDFAWIDRIKDAPGRVDVLIPNCWSLDIARLVRGVSPRLVLPAHHLEMSHDSDRQTYAQTYGRRDGTNANFGGTLGDGYQGYPMSALAWGERIAVPAQRPATDSTSGPTSKP
jgi:uroporphyrinogen-III decarboxylase/glyoxylase-like metal-dependent hydrolase (beta-lactamase superfamily II)